MDHAGEWGRLADLLLNLMYTCRTAQYTYLTLVFMSWSFCFPTLNVETRISPELQLWSLRRLNRSEVWSYDGNSFGE